MIKVEELFNFLKKKKNKEQEIFDNFKIYKKVEKDLSKKSKKIEKRKTFEENIKFIDHLKIALQFNTPRQINYIKVEINE